MNLRNNTSSAITSLKLFGLGFLIILGPLVYHIAQELRTINNNTQYENNISFAFSQSTRADSPNNTSDHLEFSNSTDDLAVHTNNDVSEEDFRRQIDTWKRKSTISKLWFILKKKRLRYNKLSIFISCFGVCFIIVGILALLDATCRKNESVNDLIHPYTALSLTSVTQETQAQQEGDAYVEFREKIFTALDDEKAAQDNSILDKLNNILPKKGFEKRNLPENIQMPSPNKNVKFTKEEWDLIIKAQNIMKGELGNNYNLEAENNA